MQRQHNRPAGHAQARPPEIVNRFGAECAQGHDSMVGTSMDLVALVGNRQYEVDLYQILRQQAEAQSRAAFNGYMPNAQQTPYPDPAAYDAYQPQQADVFARPEDYGQNGTYVDALIQEAIHGTEQGLDALLNQGPEQGAVRE